MPAPVTPAWFSEALDAFRVGDTDGWMKIYRDDAVHEFPYAPDGWPGKLEGKPAIASYMSALPSMIEFDSFHITSLREVGNELIVEAESSGKMLPGKAPFHMQYVWLISHDHGRVVRFRDYMNPLGLTSA